MAFNFLEYVNDNNKMLNFHTVRAVIILFDECYKMGVRHGYLCDDEMQINSFLDDNRHSKHFAVLVNTDAFGRNTIGETQLNLREWRFKLQMLIGSSRSARMRNIIDKYIAAVYSNNNYLGVVYDVAMDFYMLGMLDFVNNRRANIDMFNRTPFLIFGGCGKKRDTDEYIRYIQIFCADRTRIQMDERLSENVMPLGRSRYDIFALVMANLVRGRRAAVKEQRRLFNVEMESFGSNGPQKLEEEPLDMSIFDKDPFDMDTTENKGEDKEFNDLWDSV